MFVLTTSNLSFAINAEGLQSVTLPANKKTFDLSSPATSHKQFLYTDTNYPPAAGTQTLGALLSSDAGQMGNRVGITQVYAGVTAQWFFTPVPASDDLKVEVTIRPRGSLPFSNILIGLPTFRFGSPPTGNFHSWDITACAANLHPSLWNPLAAVYARASDLSVCIHPHTHLDKPTLINAAGPDPHTIPQTVSPTLFVTDTVQPGQSLTVGYTLRIRPGGVDLKSLRGAYVADMQARGPMRYTPDNRPLLACYNGTNGNLVTPDNPHGYDGAARRFDLQSGCDAFKAMIAPVVPAIQGVLFWQFGGWNSRGCNTFRPDFWNLPKLTAANLPALQKWFADNGLKFGLQTRPLSLVVPLDGDTDQLWEFDPNDQTILLRYIREFPLMHSSMTYMDSIGADLQSAQVIAAWRDRLGPGVQFYTEFASDLTIRDAGVYQQLDNLWYSQDVLNVFREIYPQCSIALDHMVDADGNPLIPVAQLGEMKKIPIVIDFMGGKCLPWLKQFCDTYLTGLNWK